MKNQLIYKTTHLWRADHLAGSVLFAFGIACLAGACTYKANHSVILALFVVIVLFGVGFYFFDKILKVKEINHLRVVQLLNAQYPDLQESTVLCLSERQSLNFLETIQLERNERILENIQRVHYPKQIYKALLFCVVCVSFGLLLHNNMLQFSLFGTNKNTSVTKEVLESNKLLETSLAEIKKVQILLTLPTYTAIPTYEAESMNLETIENTTIQWNITTQNSPKRVFLLLNEKDTLYFEQKGENKFSLTKKFEKSGFYAIGLEKDSQKHLSELYSLEIKEDRPPNIVVEKPKNSVEISFGETPVVAFQAIISDDFKVQSIDLIATLAQGTGEQVKFREIKIPLGNFNQKNVSLFKELDLRSLQMSWGDELYCYLQATDNKTSEPNVSRSETIFIAMEDTTQATSIEDFGLPINRQPDFFRSQRQIIIDTQKLIAEQSTVSKEVFEQRSADLAFDQKALRYRYGQYLGEEYEQEAGGKTNDEDHHEEKETEKDLLKAYSHDHDNEKQGDHHEKEGKIQEGKENPLEEYAHNHDSEEMNEYFQLSTRETLKKALAEMWQSELHLHLYEPKKALPFELKALKYLKQVQQKSRMYVKKVGNEQAPLKLEKRYTAELDKVKNVLSKDKKGGKQNFIAIKKTFLILEKYKSEDFKSVISASEMLVWKQAETELLELTTQQPRLYLPVLQDLKKLLKSPQSICEACLNAIEKAFSQIIDAQMPIPKTQTRSKNPLYELYLRSL